MCSNVASAMEVGCVRSDSSPGGEVLVAGVSASAWMVSGIVHGRRTVDGDVW